MKKTYFKEEELKKIANAVKKAESKTSGEIATAFIMESGTYAVYELLFAVITTFLIFTISLFCFTDIENFIKRFFWDYSSYNAVTVFGFAIFVIIFLLYFVANIQVLDRLIVPKRVMEQQVKERALRFFAESGVYKTKDGTGILIFISFLERKVELIADYGIAAKINQKEWDNIVATITSGIKAGNLVDSLVEAVEKCGELLAMHFPISKDDINELSDNLNILER
jgi:putative membrane protein